LPAELLQSLVELQEKVNKEAGKNNIRRMSLRVLERVVEHVTKFPEGGVESALRTEFPLEKGKEILEKAIAEADLAIGMRISFLENVPEGVGRVKVSKMSGDGKSVAAIGENGVAIYANGQWGEAQTDLRRGGAVAWSPDGSQLAAGGTNGVAVWANGGWGKVRTKLGWVQDIVWSPNGRKLVAKGDNGVEIYENGQWGKAETDLGLVWSVAWSSDGSKLAVGGTGGVAIYANDQWGDVMTELGKVKKVAWNLDGSQLSAGGIWGVRIRASGRWGEVKTDLGEVWRFSQRPGGTQLVAGGQKGVAIYEDDQWGEVKTDLGSVWNIAWRPDGSQLVAGGQNGVAIYENGQWGKVKMDLGKVSMVVWNSDGSKLVAEIENGVAIYANGVWAEVLRDFGGVWTVAWSPDGKRVAAERTNGVAIYANGRAWEIYPGYSCPFWYQNKWMGVLDGKIAPIEKDQATGVFSRARQEARVAVEAPTVENGELVSGPVRLPVGEEVGVPGPEYEYAGKSNAHNNRIVHEILKGIALKRNVLLVGPVGVGKSWLAMAVFRLLGQRVEHMGLHAGTTTTDLVAIRKSESRGGKLSTSYELSRLAVAMLKGRPVIIDEVNRADMGVVTKLNHLLQYGELVLSEPIEVEIDGQNQVIERIRAKEGFQIVMTMNPAGGKVTTANELTNDFIDRMYVVDVGYMPKDQEKAWLEKVWGGPNEDVQKEIAQMVEIAEASRARAAKGEGRAISTRVLERMVRYKKANPETGWMELLTMMSGVEGATQEVVWKHARIAWEAKFGAETPRGPPVVKMSTNKEAVTIGQRTWRRKDPEIASRYFNFEGIPENDRVIELMGKMRAMGEHVLLVGEAGVGKDWLALAYGELMGEDPIVMSLSKETEGTDLREWRGLKDGETHWVSSQLLKAYEEGKIIILDEITKSRPGARAALNDLMQTERIQLADGRWVKRGEGFQIIGTMNEAKEGFGGRELDDDLEDRFGAILHVKDLPAERRVAFLKRVSEAGKDTPLPESLLESLVELQEKVKEEAGKNNIRRMSLRVLERVVEHVTKFPEGGVEGALRTEFPLEKGKEILEKAIAEADLAIRVGNPLENIPGGASLVGGINVSPNGRSVVVYGNNGIVVYANGQWGEVDTDVVGVLEIAWSSDGDQLAAMGKHGLAVYANGQWSNVKTDLGEVRGIAWNPDGRKLAGYGENGVAVYENGQWGKVKSHMGEVWNIAWSLDGSQLAAGGGGVAVYKNGQWSEVEWGFGGVRDIVWSPDGTQLAARGQNGVAVNKNGKWGTMMTDLGSPLGFAWSPDGRKLAAGGEFGMAIYEDDHWSEVRTDLGEVVKFVWSPDGRKLAAIAQNILNSVVIIENGQLGEMKSGVREVWAIAWSPDGSQLAVGGRNGVAVNKNGKWGSMNTDFGWSLGVDWSPDWSKLVSRGEKGVAMYENEKWSEVRTDLGEVMKVVWNPDGSQMAAIGSKGVAIYSNGGNWETYPDYSLPFWYQNKWMGVHDRKVVPITKEEAPDVLSRARQATRVNVEAPRVENGELVSGTVRLPVGKEEGAPGPEFAYASKSNAHNNGIVHAILKGIALKRNVLLVGPVGVGKSWLAMAVFRLLGQRVEHMGLHAGTTTTDLVAIRKSESRGGKLSTSYELSRLAVAMQKGRPVIIDEVNRADMGVVTKLNHLLQYGELVLSEPIEVEIDGKKQVIERIRAKEGFQIVMTMNPAGGKVTTANELTNDFIDRMYVVDVGYMPENQEAEWLKMVAGDPSVSSDIAVLTREAARMRATEGKSPSPRSLERVIRSLRRYPNQDPSSLVTREWGLAMRPDEAKAVKTTLVAEAFGETIKHNWKTAFVAPVQRFGALVSTALNLVVQANTPDSSYDPKSWWTSGNPGWIQQQRARERQRVLKEVVRIVTGMDLPFEPWYPIRESELGRIKTWRMVWNSKTFVPREMNFVAEDLIQAGNDNSVLGVTYHELFEFLFRHPEASSPEFLAKPGAAVLDNGVGDIWINEIGMKAFRGSRPWIDAFYIEKFGTRLDPVAGVVSMAQQPLYFQFTLGVIHEWAFGRRDPSIVNPNVLEALETLCEEVRKVFEAGDVPSHKSKMQELYDTPAFQKIVEMSVKDKAQKDAASDGTLGDDVEFGDGSSGGERIPWETMSEEQRQALQKKIQEKWDSLSPEQKRKLLDKAAKDLAKRDRSVSPSDQPTLVDEKGDPLSPDQIQKVQEKIRRNIEQARKENEQYEKDQEEARLRAEEERALRDAEERKREGLTETAQADYNQRYERVRGDVHHMRRVFRLFFQQQEDYWQRWLEKGVLDDDALPLLLTGETRVYKKRTEPDKFSVRLSLLIDQSGSMDGDKISAVADTVLMMLEAIKEDQKKGIALEIVGFHDEFPAEIYFPYGAKLDKAKIVEVIAAVNKTYGDNSDMRAVVMALRRIPVVPNELNLVIHMGDGDPNFQFNRDRFRALLSKRPHVSVVGLGIGPGAQLVLDLFPPGEGVWAERSRDVPARLSEVLTRFVGRHGRNGRQRTERLSREGLAQSQNRQHPQVFQKAAGGVLGFMKGKMTLAQYARQAWWRETVVLALLGPATAILWVMAQMVFPGLPVMDLSALVDGLWAVFVGAHIVDGLLNAFRPLSEKSSPENIFYAALIALVNAPLALLPIPAVILVPVLVVNAFLSHYLINVLARSWESSRMDHSSSTVRPLLLPAFSPVLPLEPAIRARTFSEPSTVSTPPVDQGEVDPGIIDREIWRAVQTPLDETEFSAENPLGVNLTELFVPNMDPVKTQVLATFLRSLAHKARQESVRGSSIILLVRDRQVSRDVIEQKMRSLAPGLLPHATILRSGDDNASGVFVEGEDLTIKISPRGLANHCRSTHVQLAVLDQRDIINDLSGTLLLNLGAIVETVKDLIQQLKITLLITQHA
jgi:MoxR-like ATPase/WD40 repeat protein